MKRPILCQSVWLPRRVGSKVSISGILLTATIALAQQNLPLKPGEWESMTSSNGGRPVKQLLCLNDEKWAKMVVQAGLGSSPACSSEVIATVKGIRGQGSCHISLLTQYAEVGNRNTRLTNNYTDRVSLEISLDGMTHMLGSAIEVGEKTFTPLETSGQGVYRQAGPPQTETIQSTLFQLDYRWKRDKCGRTSEKLKKDVPYPTLSEIQALRNIGLPVATQVPAKQQEQKAGPAELSRSTVQEPPPQEASGAKAAYQAGLQNYYAANYEAASVAFREVVRVYPRDAEAGTAEFYLGEIALLQQNYSDAVKAYDSVLEEFGDSAKAPAAQLHKGIALLAMNKSDAGIQELRLLIQRHPNTPEASQARIRLNGLNVKLSAQ